MNYLDKNILEKIQFYVTTKYSCGYINNQEAQSMVATPYKKVDADTYSDLIQKGFRRSGQYVYKPQCNECSACIPIRICAKEFKRSQSQKRTLKKHSYVTAKILPLKFEEEHYNLYVHYQKNRHRLSSETNNDIADYNDFLNHKYTKRARRGPTMQKWAKKLSAIGILHNIETLFTHLNTL